jgi:circadian clock protein KaiC
MFEIPKMTACVPTGIAGFDAITGGGLPKGRITLVLGGAGCGKTIFGVHALAAGFRADGGTGIFVAFEETGEQILQNTAGFSWQTPDHAGITILNAQVAQSVVNGGDFDLLGLFAMIGALAKKTQATRIVLDGLDILLSHLGDSARARREVFRLREWLQESGLTSIITAKAYPQPGLVASEYDFLQFLADCVVTLQHRVAEGTALRFLRVPKCRGSAHSANEFPFSIGPDGIQVAATVNTALRHPVSNERVTSGVERLDVMLGGGYFRGSSTLITGAPGTAKTTLGAAFVDGASKRSERSLMVSFDEAPEQIMRNALSVKIDLGVHVQAGLLRVIALRSRAASPESHVAHIRALIRETRATNLVVDPISAMHHSGDTTLAQMAAMEVLDFAKSNGITSLSTSLLGQSDALLAETPLGISTIADTWMHVTYINQGGERNRALTVVKSRGTGHSNQVRELVLSDDGVTLADVYAVGGEVLMGTLRWQKEDEQRRRQETTAREAELRLREAEFALAETNARALVIKSEQAMRAAVVSRLAADDAAQLSRHEDNTNELLQRRGADIVDLAEPANGGARND